MQFNHVNEIIDRHNRRVDALNRRNQSQLRRLHKMKFSSSSTVNKRWSIVKKQLIIGI